MPLALAPLPSASVDLPPEERIKLWLGRAARQHREAAGIVRSQIAGRLAMDSGTLGRFERGESLPNDLDAVVAAYAEATDADHARDIWATALQLWAESDD